MPEKATWRAWTGLILALGGAAALAWSLAQPPALPAAEPYVFRLGFAGRPLLEAPVPPEAVAAALWLRRVGLPLLPLLVGAFFLFLETSPGKRLERRLLERWEREKKGNAP